MTATPLEAAIAALSDIQRRAANWSDGPVLVLAGPGSGKTQVLTCRIARLLDSSRTKSFRLLALTFTNKAADEMRSRVNLFVPGLDDRANICTFHGFCSQILRQHGVHLGVQPTFTIYSDDNDRLAVLEEALRVEMDAGRPLDVDAKVLKLIDQLKQRLVSPDDADAVLQRFPNRVDVVAAYRAYESTLRKLDALDFNSLIYEVHRLLVQFPAIAASYRRAYPYWLIDEFQDTNRAQYKLVKALAGSDFKNVFAVADDDQIIYQWNGASFQQIQSFTTDFAADAIQLPTNYRCPPAIVDAANRLVVYNAQRSADKKPLIAGKTSLKYPAEEHLRVCAFSTDEEEASQVAQEIAARPTETRGNTAVLARGRGLLEGMHSALTKLGVPAAITQRRDDFVSPEFRWLTSFLRQHARPLDQRNMSVLVEAFNRMAHCELSAEQVLTDAEVTGQAFIAAWLGSIAADTLDESLRQIVAHVSTLAQDSSKQRAVVDGILAEFEKRAATSPDVQEDLSAWREVSRDIGFHIGKDAPLDQFLQELQLRSKEPTPKPDTVTLMTIHGAKGREFDFVHVIGMAEEIIPSFQSLKKGPKSPEIEEERRNCFVAITRTKECLVLSYAARYGKWARKPSRFLAEMGLTSQ